MKKTLQTIRVLLDDIKGDVKLLNLTPLENKVERMSQLFEAVVRECGEKEDATK